MLSITSLYFNSIMERVREVCRELVEEWLSGCQTWLELEAQFAASSIQLHRGRYSSVNICLL